MKDTFIAFKFHYKLSRQIPFTELSKDADDVEFVKEGTQLIGFNIIMKKSMLLQDAEKESQEYAYLLSDLISVKSHKYTTPNLSGSESTYENGNARVTKALTIRYDIEGAPAKLDIYHQFANILNSNVPQIKSHLSYLAKAVIFQYQNFPDHSIMEAFKIIEADKKFKSNYIQIYEKYYALRNILAHSPEYRPKTTGFFMKYFDESTFEYRVYEPDNNLIILNLQSGKTLKKLNQLVKELMNEIKNI